MSEIQSQQPKSTKKLLDLPNGTDSGERTRKGAVYIEALPDRGLRLRWNYAGKRFVLSLGLQDSKINRNAADRKRIQIEGDIAIGNFDPTLSKYKPESQAKLKPDVLRLWQRFTDQKAYSVLPRTLETTYNPIAVKLSDYGKAIYTPQDAQKFSTWLLEQIGENWARWMLILLNACYEWSIDQDLATLNPFKGLAKTSERNARQVVLLAGFISWRLH
jgi:integrase